MESIKGTNVTARESNSTIPRTSSVPLPQSKVAWGAIFGGTFVYMAIMATFGSLGGAIFADAGHAAGMVVWMTILAIISLYVAGHASGVLSRVRDRSTGSYQGLITFGMCVFSTILVLSLTWASTTAAGSQTGITRWDVVNVAGTGGWGLFCGLFFGMLAAMGGGSRAANDQTTAEVIERPELHRVA
jgi:hypothetical protein